MSVREIGVRYVGDATDLIRATDQAEKKIDGFARRAERAGAQTAAAQSQQTQAVQQSTQAQAKAVDQAAHAQARSVREQQDTAKAAVAEARRVQQAQAAAVRDAERAAREAARVQRDLSTAATVEQREQAQAQTLASRDRLAQVRIEARERIAAARETARVEIASAREVDRAQRAATAKRRDRIEAAGTIGTGLIGAGIVAGLGIGAAVKEFADFDQAMSRAQAGTTATGKDLADLRDIAIKEGAATQYSATEAADAIAEMGKAGVETKDILAGGLKGALDLAAAGQLEVGRAGEIAATAINQFNLAGSDVPHVADVLAAAAGKAQGSVSDVAEALKYVGPVAHGLGVSFEETAGAIAELAKQGIVGEQAGTSLRGVLLTLTSPTKKTRDIMQELGIQLYDSGGKFIGLAGAAGQLQGALGRLSPAQRDVALGQIFGNEQVTAARILYQGGAEAVKYWTQQVNDSHFATRQAAALTNNLRGDLERLRGSLSTVFISSGSGTNEGLRSSVQAVKGLVDAYGKLPASVQQSVFIVGAFGAATLLAVGGVLKLVGTVVRAREALAELDITAAGTRATLTGLARVAGVVGVAFGAVELGQYIGQSQVAKVKTDDLIESLRTASRWGQASGRLTGAGAALFAQGMGPFRDEANSTAEALDRFGTSAYNALDKGWDARIGRWQDFGADQAQFRAQVTQLDAAFAKMVRSGHADEAAAQFKAFVDAGVKAGANRSVIEAQFKGYQRALEATIPPASEVVAAGRQVEAQFRAQGKSAEEAATAATAAMRKLQAAEAEAIKATRKSFVKDTDVLASYKPDDGSKTTAARERVRKATERLSEAEKRASERRQEISRRDADSQRTADRGSSGHHTATVDTRGVDSARRSLKDAQKDLADANKTAAGSGLAETYRKTIEETRQFSRDITEAARLGLDPQYIQKLLEEGPEQAGPALREIVSDHSGRLAKMVNDSERTIRKIGLQVEEQTRLTTLAVQSSTDEMTGHLDEAMAIAQAKAAAGGKATVESLAKSLHLPAKEVRKIAAEFGILLTDQVQDTVKKHPITVTARAKVNYFVQRDPTADPNVGSHLSTSVLLPRRADGGPVPGVSPNPRADDKLIAATSGEWVFGVAAVKHYGEAFMRDVQTRRFPKFADGGRVGQPAGATTVMVSPPGPAATRVVQAPAQVVRVPVRETHQRVAQFTGDIHLPSPSPDDVVDWSTTVAGHQ